jgi:hypothetical protein
MRIRTLSACLAASAFLVALGTGMPASATHCNNPVNMSSGYGADGAGEPQSAPTAHQWPACTVDSAGVRDTVDGRIIWPGATHVMPSYNLDLGAGTATLTATLNGMGFAARRVTLTRWVFVTGGATYLGTWQAIPSGPATAGGTITITVGTQTTTFKTPA